MKLTGGCHCGEVRYEIDGEPLNHALCHCTDCRRSSGAPMVGWLMMRAEQVRLLSGDPKEYQSSQDGRRFFCTRCGSGLFYRNDVMLPDIIDIQSATLDKPDAAAPQAQIQTAERIGWMATAHDLPMFDRFPPMG